MPRIARTLRTLSCTLFLFALTACHQCGHGDVGNGGDLVGGACSDDGDCVDRCVRGGDFPDGTCTVDCSDDHDCPDGSLCIDKAGGVCLLTCSVDDDCRGSYNCKDVKREGAGGDAAVCID